MKSVLITGGSEGIGLAVARLLAAESGTCITLVARNEKKLEEAVAGLPGQGHDYVVADLSHNHDCRRDLPPLWPEGWKRCLRRPASISTNARAA